MSKTKLISAFEKALQNKRSGQEILYEMFSGKMLYIAKSYFYTIEPAEDVVIESFYKAFTQIKNCQNAQSFESWLRKIIINKCIDELRKQRKLIFVNVTDFEENITEEDNSFEGENLQDLLELLKNMPNGYRLVFNLYFFEEKKHQEISELLNINIGTSKSQLNKAKNWLKSNFKKNTNESK